jgi:predicted GNAT family acetyltransferase
MSAELNDDVPEATADPRGRVQVTLDERASRYEGRIGSQLVGVVDFTRHGQTAHVTHTGTEPRWRGQGVAEELTRYVLEDLRASGLQLRPVCPYTAHFVDEHPEYADLLS